MVWICSQPCLDGIDLNPDEHEVVDLTESVADDTDVQAQPASALAPSPRPGTGPAGMTSECVSSGYY